MEQGWRKVILAAAFGAGILGFGQNMTPTQADVMMALIISVFAANGVEHVAKGVKDAVTNRSRARAVGAARTVTVQEPKNGDEGAH